MFLRVSTVLLAIAALGVADTLTLRSGQVVRGEYLGGDARHVKMAVGDRVETYSVEDVSDLSFGSGQNMSSDNDRRDNVVQAAPPDQSSAVQPPAALATAAGSGVVIPICTSITVRMIDSVNSEQSRLGETFRASVDEPVIDRSEERRVGKQGRFR